MRISTKYRGSYRKRIYEQGFSIIPNWNNKYYTFAYAANPKLCTFISHSLLIALNFIFLWKSTNKIKK